MLAPFALLMYLVTMPNAPDPNPAAAIRKERPVAVWVTPQLTFHSIGSGRADIAGSDAGMLPLGLTGGVQLGERGFLFLSYGRLPVQYIQRTQVTFGGRWYLSNAKLAPYLAAEAGSMREELDDTGGQIATHIFAIAGVGAELVLPFGLSITTDLELGPEHQSDYTASTWHFSGWYRLGLGFRF